ncbi:MAG: spore coat associated protein CotJA [Clostridium sp.]|nr:spore coat associated protein CotJA [Clostridium sp.]
MIYMSKNEKLEYARAYILLQKYGNLYSLSEALCKGTIFADLYRPYKRNR